MVPIQEKKDFNDGPTVKDIKGGQTGSECFSFLSGRVRSLCEIPDSRSWPDVLVLVFDCYKVFLRMTHESGAASPQ